MLAPRWEISEHRRGTIEFQHDLANAILDPAHRAELPNLMKKRLFRLITPSGWASQRIRRLSDMQHDIETLLDAEIELGDVVARGHRWDLFISAYNNRKRVQTVFTQVPAARKSWWIVPEYGYTPADLADLENPVLLARGSEAQW